MSNCVYILHDEISDKFYVGQTANLEDRLGRHFGKREKSTKSGSWKLFYQERFTNRSDAITREKEIKGWKSKIMIRKLITDKNQQ